MSQFDTLREAAFFARGALFLGNRFRCPCCGWSLRAFVAAGALLAREEAGYCPRCNAKARHRRLWLYLAQKTDVFRSPTRLLEVAPWWSLSRRMGRTTGLHYVGVDLERQHAGVGVIGDVTALPFGTSSFDAVLCIHVLEHVAGDRQAMAELHRVLRPGGWALVSAPVRLDRATHEDASVTEPEERRRVFGERGHVRFYGADLRARLEAAGFEVSMDAGDRIPAEVCTRYGLRTDEHIFHCHRKA